MLTAGKLPASLLFSGPEGSGKELMAIHLAGMINCEMPGHQAEDRCASCEKLSTLEYPDLHLIYASGLYFSLGAHNEVANLAQCQSIGQPFPIIPQQV